MLPSASEYPTRDFDPLPQYYWPLVGSLYRRRVEICLELLQGGQRVLEVGFGSGVSFLNLAQGYAEIHGLDLDADCANVSRLFATHGVNTQLINGSVTQMPYPDAHFDAVLLVSILEHLRPEDQDAACREIQRVLRPGGVMVVGVPVERPLMVLAFRLLGYNIREHHFSTEKEVFAAAAKHLRPDEERVLRGMGGLCGPIYMAKRFVKV